MTPPPLTNRLPVAQFLPIPHAVAAIVGFVGHHDRHRVALDMGSLMMKRRQKTGHTIREFISRL
jgi:hypothetical protein